MSTIDTTLQLSVPVRTAYNQWTQFEEFPLFMDGIQYVRRIDTRHVHWHVELGGRSFQWEAEIVEMIPDRVIVWKSIAGEPNEGRVEFEPVGADQCRLHLHLRYEPRGSVATLADRLGLIRRRTLRELDRFRRFIERRRVETGSFRGRIPKSA
jgi:uncharacterized membrane protein